MTLSDLIFVPYRLACAEVRDGDLLLFRRRGLISIAGRGEHSHAAKAAWWSGDLFCLEVREWHGGRAVTLASQVNRWPGKIDVYRTNPDNRWPQYDRAGAVRYMRLLAGTNYGYRGVLAASLLHLPLARLFARADMRDADLSVRPPFCSQACAMSDRIGGGVDPVAHLADRMTLSADPRAQPVLRISIHVDAIGQTMRFMFAIAVSSVLAASAGRGDCAELGVCINGQCPSGVTSGNSLGYAPPTIAIDTRAVVRVVNAQGGSRSAGTGTLIDADSQRGLIITCAHLFREGAGRLTVTFPDGRAFAAILVKLDNAADLAVLSIATPGIAPVVVAEQSPQLGDSLVSCGYGGNGQLLCNQGQMLGYVTTPPGQRLETLELSGGARFGDSGGPVFNRKRELVAVLFGTNGRVVDGTFCGRIRRFLAGLSPKFGSGQVSPPKPAAPLPGAVEEAAPLVEVPPPNLPPRPNRVEESKLTRLEQVVARLLEGWQSLNAKVEKLANAAKDTSPSKALPSENPMAQPPTIELPSDANSTASPADTIGAVAEPWLSAKLATLLVSLGIPGGVAGVAAGAAVWLVMRRGKKRLQAQLDRMKATNGVTVSTTDAADSADQPTIERHHNRYVAYEISALDKAWAAAHAHVGEKYPGAVPYLKIAESVKDQLLSGSSDTQLS